MYRQIGMLTYKLKTGSSAERTGTRYCLLDGCISCSGNTVRRSAHCRSHKPGQTYCAAGFLPASGMVIPLAIMSTPTRFKLLIVSAAGIIANILGAIGGYLYLV